MKVKRLMPSEFEIQGITKIFGRSRQIWRRLPRAAGLFDAFGYCENQFIFVGAADNLDADGKTVGGEG